MTLPTYSIEVTEDIATKIRTMAEAGVFRMRNGSVEMHFTNDGTINLVTLHIQHRVVHRSTNSEIDMKSGML